MERWRRLVAMIGGIGLVIGITAGPALAADRDVAILGLAFSPRSVTVQVGDIVSWTNGDAQAHTATSGRAWTTGDIATGDSASIMFRTAGTFDYICAIHPTMTGRVVVRAGAAPPTDTTSLVRPARYELSPVTLAFLASVTVAALLVTRRRLGRRAGG